MCQAPQPGVVSLVGFALWAPWPLEPGQQVPLEKNVHGGLEPTKSPTLEIRKKNIKPIHLHDFLGSKCEFCRGGIKPPSSSAFLVISW